MMQNSVFEMKVQGEEQTEFFSPQNNYIKSSLLGNLICTLTQMIVPTLEAIPALWP
jgi:hypothetical protein